MSLKEVTVKRRVEHYDKEGVPVTLLMQIQYVLCDRILLYTHTTQRTKSWKYIHQNITYTVISSARIIEDSYVFMAIFIFTMNENSNY